MIKNSNTPYASWGNKPGSYFSTLNPFSGIMGTSDRVPEWWMNIMPGDIAGIDSKHMAHLAFKTGACALLAAAVVGGYRAAKHFQTANELEAKDSTAKKITSGLDNSFPTDMSNMSNISKGASSKDDGKWIERPSMSSFSNVAGAVLPVGATLLAASIAYSMVDEWADNRRNNLLDEAIKRKQNAVKQLVQTRGRIARGTATDKELKKVNNIADSNNIYVKQASITKEGGLGLLDLPRKSFQGMGLLASALLVASAIGGYEYFKATDEDNIRFKATEKGLNEYAKHKVNTSTVNIVPTDAGTYFDKIDAGAPKETDRTAREIDTDEMNKPISISL